MTTNVETIRPLERKLSLTLSMERIDAEVEQRLKKLSRTVHLHGFRRGKVPLKIMAQNYGSQVRSEVLNDELERSFREAVEIQQLRVAASPNIEPASDQPEGHLLFEARFEVLPDIQFNDFSSLDIEKPESAVGEAEIDRTIDILRKQRASFEAVERPSCDDDRMNIDFVGTLDGVAFEGGTAQNFPFYVGKKQMLPVFEDAVRGMKAGESKALDLTFPEDYQNKDIAGKTVQFEVTVNKVEAPVLPALDEKFAKELGVVSGDIAQLREDVRLNLSREVSNRLKARTKESVMNGLLKMAEFDVPTSLIQKETEDLLKRAYEDFKERGLTDPADFKLPIDVLKAQAERRVRLSLMVSELVKTHQLQVKPEQVRAYIEELAQSYENPIEVMQWYFADRSRLNDLEAAVLENNIVDWVLSQSKVVTKTWSFDELMGNV